jgi:hypothetical protein
VLALNTIYKGSSISEFIITCPKVHIIGKLNGLSGANGANALIVLLFHGCKLDGNGAGVRTIRRTESGRKGTRRGPLCRS